MSKQRNQQGSIASGTERPTMNGESSAHETGYKPTREEISQRAFEIYEESGHKDGQCVKNWLQAEKELLGRGSDDAVPRQEA